MGDFTKDGTKIGTCGQAYYATKPMLEKLVGDKEVDYYLDPKNNCSFAFPFPDYENKRIGEISNFHEDQKVDFVISIKNQGVTHHGRIIHTVHPKGGQQINLYSECPYSNPDLVSSNFDKSNVRFYLAEQMYYRGELAVKARCIYCGEPNILDPEEALEVSENIMLQVANETNVERSIYLTKISTEILNTYIK